MVINQMTKHGYYYRTQTSLSIHGRLNKKPSESHKIWRYN